MGFKSSLKRIVLKVRVLNYIYNNIYLKYIQWKRFNVHITDAGTNNIVTIPKTTYASDFRITFRGNNNKVIIGKGCELKNINYVYIQGDGNILEIGDNVIFDEGVLIVLGEGTKCTIGSGCIFAYGVRIRTTDQHFIYDAQEGRVNPAKDVSIGNHVWLGASVIVMKGVTIGDGSVIGIDSMVTKNIPENCVAVGKPAKVIKNNIHWKG